MSSDGFNARFQKDFQFIDSNDKSARKKSRAHVTKEFYRERRWKQVHSHSEPNSTTSSPPARQTSSTFVVSVTKFGSTQQSPGSASSTDALTTEDAGKSPAKKDLQLCCTTALDPKTLLGAGRVDPFQTYPIESAWIVHRLVDHYHFVIPSLLHKKWGRHISHPMPIMDLFEVYRQDAVPFLAMLHHASNHLAKLENNKEETSQILEYKYRTIRLLHERINASTGPYDDGTILGAGLLANAEQIWGDNNVARMHWTAFKRMIVDRGGFPAFKENRLVHTKLTWSFIALSGPSLADNPIFLDTFPKPVAAHRSAHGPSLDSAFHRACDEFLGFFFKRKADSIKAISQRQQADRECHAEHPLRCRSFRPGTRIHGALSPVGRTPDNFEKHRAVDHCRIGCLLYLNAVLAEHGDFSVETERFLQKFADFVEDDDPDCTLSAEHLLWALIRGIHEEESENHERVWMVLRMIGVLKKADRKTWWDVEEALRLFLTIPEDGSKLMDHFVHLDAEAVRKSILAVAARETKICGNGGATITEIQDELDFLPETRDAQWVPWAQSQAGVHPHPMCAVVLSKSN